MNLLPILFLTFALIPFLSLINPKIAHWIGIGGSIVYSLISILTMLGSFPLLKYNFENINFALNQLNSVFLFIISVVEIMVFSLSIKYLPQDKKLSFFIGLTLLSINSVIISWNVVLFLMFWELMTISGYLLIGFKKDSKAYPSFVFIAFGELSTLFLTVGFAGYYFSTGTLILGHSLNNPYILTVIVLGFLFKMGMVPLQMVEWLPIAHGNSPTPGSIIFSAAMTTLALYGIVLFVVSSTANLVLGLVLMIIGSFSLMFGSIYALSSENSKMLPAYSTVENSGAMILLVGMAICWNYYGNSSMELFILLGIFIFATAHAWAKSAVFIISARSREHSINGKSGSELSPFSRFSGAIAVISLMGLAPIGGGIGEWFLLESLFISSSSTHLLLALVSIVTGSLAALGAGITIPTFTKFFNFMTIKKDTEENGTDINKSISLAGILILSISIFSPAFIYLYSFVGSKILNLGHTLIFLSNLKGIYYPFLIYSPSFSGGFFGFMSPIFIIIFLSVGSLIAALFSKAQSRPIPIWNGGIEQEHWFNSFAYANNLRIIMRKIYLSKEEKSEGQYQERTFDIFWLIILDFSRSFSKLSSIFARKFMNGNINQYVIYIICAFFLVLILVVLI